MARMGSPGLRRRRPVRSVPINVVIHDNPKLGFLLRKKCESDNGTQVMNQWPGVTNMNRDS
jgi:hypothetical protein